PPGWPPSSALHLLRRSRPQTSIPPCPMLRGAASGPRCLRRNRVHTIPANDDTSEEHLQDQDGSSPACGRDEICLLHGTDAVVHDQSQITSCDVPGLGVYSLHNARTHGPEGPA